MARPRKQNVKYFPHDTDASLSSKETIPALETRWGNDGYAFWFKLLELLGRQPGLYFDYSTPRRLEFLRAQTNQKDTDTVLAMLALLDTLEAVDHELYTNKIIWCQNYVEGVKGAFDRTVQGVPERPEIGLMYDNEEFMQSETPENDTEMPQIKLDYIKVKEIYKEKGDNGNFCNGEEDGDAVVLWRRVLEVIKPQVSGFNYRTWFENTKGIVLGEDILTVGVPNSTVLDYLSENQQSVIEKSVLDIAPGLGVELRINNGKGGK